MIFLPPEIDAAQIESGAQDLIGYDIDLTAPDGGATVSLDVQTQHLNRNQTLHGGIVTMLLDAAAGFAASRMGTESGFDPVVTVALNTQFIAPAALERVTARGRMIGGGRSILYAEAILTNESGTQLALANGVFKRHRKKG